MADDENFLSRWSRRKTQAKASPEEVTPSQATSPAALAATGDLPAAVPAPHEAQPLPPVDSLTPESDFSPFMAPEVDGDLRTKALRTLFRDPRFNTMDMMDVYVDDYSKPDPLPDSWLAKMEQMSWLGDRAGRDREEAERRKEREQGTAPAQREATSGRVGADVPAADSAAAGGPAQGDRPPTQSDTSEPAIPPAKVGESGI